MRKRLLLCLLPCSLFCFEHAPWFETAFAPRIRDTIRTQTFERIEGAESGAKRYPSNDLFLTLSLDSALLHPFTLEDGYHIELSTTFSKTRKRTLSFDEAFIAFRMRALNDRLCDPFSLTYGLRFIAAYKQALEDPASFHHGLYTLEGHFAIGREVIFKNQQLMRGYGVFALGQAERGCPYARGFFALEKSVSPCTLFSFFLAPLGGFGTNPLLSPYDFSGYGMIKHRSLDIGAKIDQSVFGGVLSLSAAYRPYARNFPEKVWNVLFRLEVPIPVYIASPF